MLRTKKAHMPFWRLFSLWVEKKSLERSSLTLSLLLLPTLLLASITLFIAGRGGFSALPLFLGLGLALIICLSRAGLIVALSLPLLYIYFSSHKNLFGITLLTSVALEMVVFWLILQQVEQVIKEWSLKEAQKRQPLLRLIEELHNERASARYEQRSMVEVPLLEISDSIVAAPQPRVFEGLYKQLRAQFEEKSHQLNATRRQLFELETHCFALRQELEERNRESPEDLAFMLIVKQQQELSILEAEIYLLEELTSWVFESSSLFE